MPVVADIWDLLGPLLALLVPLLWGLKQVADAAKENRPPEGKQAPPRQRAPQPAQRAAGRQAAGQQAAGQQADPLRSQVEEFLRRTGRAPQAAEERPAEREVEVLIEEPAKPQPVGEFAGGAATAAVTTEALADAPVSTTLHRAGAKKRALTQRDRKTLAERAMERAAARARRSAAQASRLGKRIIEDDHQFDVQLKAKFDHTVGTLAGSVAPVIEPAAADSPAAQIAAMLASPEGVRQAIVINEVLSRPTDRW